MGHGMMSDSIPYEVTKELMRFHCGCHGNKVTIAMRYEAEPIVSISNMDLI